MYKVIPKEESDLPKLGQPALRALFGAGITRLEQVAALSEVELKGLHGIGPNAVEALRKALAERGLSFAPAKEARLDNTTRQQLEAVFGEDKEARTQAYFALMEATMLPVPWSYEAWNALLAGLRHKDNHVRSICAQVLCHLSASDPDNRILHDFEALLSVTRDERFVTARHTLQNIWKVALAGEPQRQLLLQGLSRRFEECATEKNCTLIRYDILQGMRNLYDQIRDETIRARAMDWIQIEPDEKYRQKYATLWKKT